MDKEAKREIEDYLQSVARAATWIGGEEWRNPDFALARAREIGHALADSCKDWEQVSRLITGTYSTILVRAAGLKPPLDNEEWITEIKCGFMRRVRPFPGIKQIPANAEMLKEAINH